MSQLPAPYRVKLDSAVPERVLQEQVRMLAKLNGWLFFHPWIAKHSPSGWPDVFAVKIGECRMVVVVAELKRVGRKPTLAQQEWLDVFTRLACCLAPHGRLEIEMIVRVWTPADFDQIQETFEREV